MRMTEAPQFQLEQYSKFKTELDEFRHEVPQEEQAYRYFPADFKRQFARFPNIATFSQELQERLDDIVRKQVTHEVSAYLNQVMWPQPNFSINRNYLYTFIELAGYVSGNLIRAMREMVRFRDAWQLMRNAYGADAQQRAEKRMAAAEEELQRLCQSAIAEGWFPELRTVFEMSKERAPELLGINLLALE